MKTSKGISNISKAPLVASRGSAPVRITPNRYVLAQPLTSASELIRRACTGGFPEVVSRQDDDRRSAWFSAYITTILQRDIRDLANIAGLTDQFHFRTSSAQEVDLVLEDAAGRVLGIEVEAGATWDWNDLRGLKTLAASTGERFHRGILLHRGDQALPCGPRIDALPIRALWEF